MSPLIRKLQDLLPSELLLPGSEEYLESLRSYFTTQETELQPICIVKPGSTEDVVAIVREAQKDETVSIAIRSGGHNPSPGSANSDGGVTLDLRNLSKIEVNEPKTIVSVGAGAIWGHIYEKLEPLGLSVVGIAGFLLEGGLSSLSPRFGLACDMVNNFEVVLASGEIINANANEPRDLWIALKGGSNNFGIVTRFDLARFPEGNIWGGYIVSPMTSLDENIKALADMPDDWDEFASIKQSYTFSMKTKYSIATNFEYTKDVAEPEVVKPFLASKPLFRNTLATKYLSQLAVEIQQLQAAATRQAFYTTSFTLSLSHLHDVIDIFKEHVAAVETVDGLRSTLTYQRLHGAIYRRGVERGGNSSGLENSATPLVLAT